MKLVYSSNPTKRNVCNISSVSQFIISKPVCFSNATDRNVSNASTVSTVLNCSSASQLVKTFNVCKHVCSSNASNPVICSSTFNTVSKFVTSCHLVKPVCKLVVRRLKSPCE